MKTAKDLRDHEILVDFVSSAYGSCLIRTGETRVICTASVENSVPPFMRGQGKGWLTAEYAMLPASTGRRKQREYNKRDGRSVEISRLIGRALRQAVDLTWLGEKTITIDCDVLTADGGTRTASITGGFVALVLAVQKLLNEGKIKESPITNHVAAVSAGVVQNVPTLDLCYIEDSTADVDMNFVMNDKGAFIELQGTGEGRAFSESELTEILALGKKGCKELIDLQKEVLKDSVNLIGQKHTLVLASNNAHKIKELKSMVGDKFTVLSLKEAGITEEIEENGTTFAQNAEIKAEFVMKKTGYVALADDSGLCVDMLEGAPGVHSARYAGEHGNDDANNQLLIENLKSMQRPIRAHFVSALSLCLPNGDKKTVEGMCNGVIIDEARGEKGFGYDPHFLYEEMGKTFAEMNEEEKNAISHRALAMQKMRPILEEI